MTVKEFMEKYESLKTEIGLKNFYIPHICDKLYPWVCKFQPTKKAVIKEILKYYEEYKRLPINIGIPTQKDLTVFENYKKSC